MTHTMWDVVLVGWYAAAALFLVADAAARSEPWLRRALGRPPEPGDGLTAWLVSPLLAAVAALELTVWAARGAVRAAAGALARSRYGCANDGVRP
jgi:hypothetical protein